MAKSKTTKFNTFEGFPEDGFKFLKQLAKNNKKEWFEKNRQRYEQSIKAPLQAFVADCEREFGSGKVFRIHRDVRFSNDKTPYKTNASAVFEKKGIVYYAHFEPKQVFSATGMHMMAKDQLVRFYEAIDDTRKGKALVKLVDEAREAGLTVGGSSLKTAPRGYAKDHERIELLRHKGLTVSREFERADWMHTAEAGERIAAAWREGAGISAWLTKHVGESEEGRRFVKR